MATRANRGRSALPAFVPYLFGYAILSAGIPSGASILGVSNQWIAVIGLVLLGVGVIKDLAKTRRRDAPAANEPHSDNA